MRPHSEIRVLLAAAMVDGGGTSRELARRVCASHGLAMRTLDNMVRAGDARKARAVRVPGVKRPVPVYERAMRADAAAAAAANDAPYQSLIQAWLGRAAA